MPQLRQNIITGEWVVIAPERAKRPTDFVIAETIKPESKLDCPFCVASHQYQHTRLKNFESTNVYVIPNKYPAFLEKHQTASPRTYHLENHFYHAKPALGGHDVIVIKDHDLNLFTFSQKIWTDLFEMIAKRYRFWRDNDNTEYTMMIYNQGQKAGASIYHPHAQLFASDIIPNQVVKEQHGAENYFEKYGSCVFCELIKHELNQKVRIVYESKTMVACTFYAARFPFEIWLLPKQHLSHFEQTIDSDYAEISKCLLAVLNKLSRTLHNPPLNFYIHDLPAALTDAKYYHWHIEITPRVSTYGGYELGSGVVIDVMPPEEAAEYLNKK